MKDRRTSPRLRMLIELNGQVIPLGTRITLVDISRTGMGIRTELRLPEDAKHLFELTLPDGSAVRLEGRLARCERAADGRFTAGIRFSDPASVAEVLHRIAAAAVPGVAEARSGARA